MDGSTKKSYLPLMSQAYGQTKTSQSTEVLDSLQWLFEAPLVRVTATQDPGLVPQVNTLCWGGMTGSEDKSI